MSTLRDLRETLDERAATVDDPDRYARPVAVRARIRAARQRRAVAGGVAAALVLAAGVTAAGSLGGEPGRVEPAGVVVGIDVPEEATIYGFPYELTDTDPFEGAGDRIRIDGAEPQAVALAARDLGAGSATLYLDGDAVARVFDDGASAPVTVWEGGRLSVRFDGADDTARAGLAFYTATGELAPGVDDGEVVFRDVVGSATRLDAAFDDTGEVELPYEGRLPDLRVATTCPGAAAGAFLTVEVDGEPWSMGPCVFDGHRDPAGTGLDGTGGFADGRQHTIRAVLTDGRTGPVLSDARVGLGLYTMETSLVGGTDVPSRVEMLGRTWALDPVGVTTLRGVDDWKRTLETTDSDVLIGVAGRTGNGGMLRVDWNGRLSRGSSPYIEATWGASLQGGLLPRGDTFEVRITGDDVRTASLLIYRPV